MWGRAPAHRAERHWRVRPAVRLLTGVVVLAGGVVAGTTVRLTGAQDGKDDDHERLALLGSTAVLVVAALALLGGMYLTGRTFARSQQQAELELTSRMENTREALERVVADTRSQADRMRAERDLSMTILHRTVALVVVLDPKGCLADVNAACLQLTGFAEADLVGRGFWEVLFAQEDVPRFARELRRVAEHDEQSTVEATWRTADGGTRQVALTPIALRDRDGEITFYVCTGVDVTHQRSREERLRRLADTDPLTGLVNRQALRRELAYSLDDTTGAGAALLFCDLDGFKAVNDTFGHATGDQLLVAVARRMRESVRTRDTVARLGGDEFVILCPGLSFDDTCRLAHRVQEVVARPYRLPAGEVRVGVSVGSALAQVGADPALTMRVADQAMYRQKAERALASGRTPRSSAAN